MYIQSNILFTGNCRVAPGHFVRRKQTSAVMMALRGWSSLGYSTHPDIIHVYIVSRKLFWRNQFLTLTVTPLIMSKCILQQKFPGDIILTGKNMCNDKVVYLLSFLCVMPLSRKNWTVEFCGDLYHTFIGNYVRMCGCSQSVTDSYYSKPLRVIYNVDDNVQRRRTPKGTALGCWKQHVRSVYSVIVLDCRLNLFVSPPPLSRYFSNNNEDCHYIHWCT